jgi:arabinofuranan 3-O-arabinosyltransferase
MVDGLVRRTSVDGTLADLIALRPLRITGCDEALMGPGRHVVEDGAAGPLVIDTLTLTPSGHRSAPSTTRTARVERWDAEQRQVAVGPGGPALLTVAENFNRGWRASLHGHPLEPLRLDGWKQAWRLPAGRSGTVELTFAPGRTYRTALAVGATAVVVLALLALVPGRRRPEVPPALPGAVNRTALGALAVVVLASLGGIAGLVVVVAVAAVPIGRARLAATSFLVATTLAVFGVAVDSAVSPGRFGGAVQALTLLALAAVTVPRRQGTDDP